jgi:hypothetical protein
MRAKVKAFLNGLTNDEAYLFWRFLRTRIWTEWVNTRVGWQIIK